MKTKDCKIIFNTLIKRMWKIKASDPTVELPFYSIDELVLFITKKKKTDRFYDLKDNKFFFLETADISETKGSILVTGFFKSARNEFRPNVINKRTGEERTNPKTRAEGDIEKTHFIIKVDQKAKEVYLFLEYNFHGVHTNNVVNYLKFFNDQYLESKDEKRSYTITHLVIARNNFLTELEKLKRTRLAEIYFDKQLLGSNALNFSNRYVSVKRELKLVASASIDESITEVAVDFYNALNKQKSLVNKVRIYGNDEYDNEIVLDTTFMSKVEFITVDVNDDTGEVNTTQLFTGLKRIANSF